MRVISRYLLPPMLKTTQLPTMLAVPNSAFTSPHVCHETVLLFTCVYHARNGPSESPLSDNLQNCRSRALEMTRIRCCSLLSASNHIVVRKIRTVNARVRKLRTPDAERQLCRWAASSIGEYLLLDRADHGVLLAFGSPITRGHSCRRIAFAKGKSKSELSSTKDENSPRSGRPSSAVKSLATRISKTVNSV